MAKNLHLEHPEDQILTGDRSVLGWFYATSHSSVKMDGAPAIVWGTNPENGKFFVGTKSVFNKKKIKICYSQKDIFNLYQKQFKLVGILSACLAHLPRTKGVYQGDFIGFGGNHTYTPNTLTYRFEDVIHEEIIIAPHTIYTGKCLKEMNSSPLMDVMDNTDAVRFVQPTVDTLNEKDNEETFNQCFDDVEEFLTEKQAKEVKTIINSFIREGKVLTVDLLEVIFDNRELAILYCFTLLEKYRLLENTIVYDDPYPIRDGEIIDHEGIVRTNQFGSMKLVNRYEFSANNFNNDKFRSVDS